MWRKLRRFLNSLLSNWVKKRENPREILLQNIQDLTDQIQNLNANIAAVKANVILLERERDRLESKNTSLKARIMDSLDSGHRGQAIGTAKELKAGHERLADVMYRLKTAEKAFEQALETKKKFLEEKQQMTRESINAIRKSERAEWMRTIADALENAENYGARMTHDDMVARISERSDYDEARLQVLMERAEDGYPASYTESPESIVAAIEAEHHKIADESKVNSRKSNNENN